jgi:integrase
VPRDEDIAELDRIIEADAKTVRSYAGSTQAHMRSCLGRFEAFLKSLGVEGGFEELADLVDRNDAGAPILPSPLVAAFQIACCETQKPSTAVGTAGTAVSALAVRGWDTTVAAEARRKGLSRTIRLNAERLSPDELVAARRRARPLLPENARSLLGTLDEIEANPGATVSLWIALWRAIICVGWFCGLRPAELVQLKWSWIRFVAVDGEDALLVEIRAAKYTKPRTVLVTATGNNLCAMGTLAAWRKAASEAGVPTGPEDPVFVQVHRRDINIPSVSRGPGRVGRDGRTVSDLPELVEDLDHDASVQRFAELNPTASVSTLGRVFDSGRVRVGAADAASRDVFCWRCARCGWQTTSSVADRLGCKSCAPAPHIAKARVACVQYFDPVAAFLTNDSWRPELPSEERQAIAVSNVCRTLRAEWDKLRRSAGFEERSSLERPSLYAMRRGTATTMHLAGATIWEIQQVLGHDSPNTTSIYISNADVGEEDIAGVLDEGSHRQPNDVPDVLFDLSNGKPSTSEASRDCEIEHGGTACGREFRLSAEIGGRRLGLCSAHYQRFRRGVRGSSLTRPIRARKVRNRG